MDIKEKAHDQVFSDMKTNYMQIEAQRNFPYKFSFDNH